MEINESHTLLLQRPVPSLPSVPSASPNQNPDQAQSPLSLSSSSPSPSLLRRAAPALSPVDVDFYFFAPWSSPVSSRCSPAFHHYNGPPPSHFLFLITPSDKPKSLLDIRHHYDQSLQYLHTKNLNQSIDHLRPLTFGHELPHRPSNAAVPAAFTPARAQTRSHHTGTALSAVCIEHEREASTT